MGKICLETRILYTREEKAVKVSESMGWKVQVKKLVVEHDQLFKMFFPNAPAPPPPIHGVRRRTLAPVTTSLGESFTKTEQEQEASKGEI